LSTATFDLDAAVGRRRRRLIRLARRKADRYAELLAGLQG